MTQPPGILEKVLKEAWEAQHAERPFLAVFDLDSTLFDLTTRIERILHSFADRPEMKSRFPELCVRLPEVRINPRDWGIQEPLGRHGMMDNDDFFAEIHAHWVQHFFSNRYLHEDIPLPGAVEFVKELRALGAHIQYLTGRDVGRMWEGTIASLKQWDFPLEPGSSEAVLKPDSAMDDALFKLGVLQKATGSYSRIWFFENEPVNINLVRENLPHVGLVFIDTTHSGRQQVDLALPRIDHFETDLLSFKNALNLKG